MTERVEQYMRLLGEMVHLKEMDGPKAQWLLDELDRAFLLLTMEEACEVERLVDKQVTELFDGL